MRTCVFVTQTTTIHLGGGIDLTLRRFGYELHLADQLARNAPASDDILLVDARGATKDFYTKLGDHIAARQPTAVIAIIDPEQQRIVHRLALLEAGVDVVLPWDPARLPSQLAMALEEIHGRPAPDTDEQEGQWV